MYRYPVMCVYDGLGSLVRGCAVVGKAPMVPTGPESSMHAYFPTNDTIGQIFGKVFQPL